MVENIYQSTSNNICMSTLKCYPLPQMLSTPACSIVNLLIDAHESRKIIHFRPLSGSKGKVKNRQYFHCLFLGLRAKPFPHGG